MKIFVMRIYYIISQNEQHISRKKSYLGLAACTFNATRDGCGELTIYDAADVK